MHNLYKQFQNKDADHILSYIDANYVNERYKINTGSNLKYDFKRKQSLFSNFIWNVFDITHLESSTYKLLIN